MKTATTTENTTTTISLSIDQFKSMLDKIDDTIVTKENQKINGNIHLSVTLSEALKVKDNPHKISKYTQNNDTGNVSLSFKREYINLFVAKVYGLTSINEVLLYVLDNKKQQAFNVFIASVVKEKKESLLMA